MTLRSRLFVVFGSLLSILLIAQWWWVRSLTRDLTDELGVVAFAVGTQMADVLLSPDSPCPEGADCTEERVVKRVHTFHVPAPEGAAVADAGGDEAPKDTLTRTFEVRTLQPRKADEDVRVDGDQAHYTVRLEARVDGPAKVVGDGGREGDVVWFSTRRPAAADERYLALVGPDVERRIPIPHQRFEDRLAHFSRRLMLGSTALLGVGLLLAGFVAHRVTAPLRGLSAAARRLGEGELGAQVEIDAGGEVADAIEAFNGMSRQLQELDARARALAEHQHLGEIGEIARGLAHTLRNPLNALGLSVEELAAQAPAEEPAASLASAARRQIRRIDHSIRSFLVLASQGGGAVADVAVGDLVHDVALEALQDARGKVRLDVQAAGDLAPLAAVEPELRAVVQALVVNAVDASPEGGTVSVRLAAAGPGLRIEIDDDGPGLPEAVRERLFTPHLSTKANGSGMGLYLAHRIATSFYGGRLELRDRDQGGTSAILELGPRRREANDE